MATQSTAPSLVPASAPTSEAAAPAAPTGSKKRVFIVLGIGALALAGFFGYRYANASLQTTDDAQVEAEVVPLGVRVGGQVLSVKVHDNALVKKGDVLVEIDPAD